MPISLEPLPPKQAIDFLKSKGYAIGFDWRDVWRQEHGWAFTVAKAMRVDVLSDIKTALEQALKDGLTVDQFKADLAPKLIEKGWWGSQAEYDPLTKQYKNVRLGSSSRLNLIFHTNISAAYSYGRWQDIERLSKDRPWLRYVTVQDGRARPAHQAIHGIVLKWDDAFWDTHYPPNGWRCRCIVQQYSDDDLEEFGFKPSDPPKIQYKEYRNTRTGEVTKIPADVSPGFDYNVGKSRSKAFTPPPEGGLPKSFPTPEYRPPLPKPTTVPPELLLPNTVSRNDAVQAFMKSFDGDINDTIHHVDPTGLTLPISEQIFRRPSGRDKLYQDRLSQVLLFAETIKNPDEIWWEWEQDKSGQDNWFLKRRFIKRWKLDQARSGIAVFDWSKTGWNAATVFVDTKKKSEQSEKYIDGLRGGFLAFSKTPE